MLNIDIQSILVIILQYLSNKRINKMSDSNNTRSGGISFSGLLTILFIGLKLTNYIDWSWWWVLSPLWIGFVILLVVLLGMGIVYYISER